MIILLRFKKITTVKKKKSLSKAFVRNRLSYIIPVF